MAQKKAPKKKATPQEWIRQNCGEQTTEAILNKVNRMADKGASLAQIKSAVAKDLKEKMQGVMLRIPIIWEVNKK